MVHSWTFFLIIILEIYWYLVFLAMCTGRVLVGYFYVSNLD